MLLFPRVGNNNAVNVVFAVQKILPAAVISNFKGCRMSFVSRSNITSEQNLQ